MWEMSINGNQFLDYYQLKKKDVQPMGGDVHTWTVYDPGKQFSTGTLHVLPTQ